MDDLSDETPVIESRGLLGTCLGRLSLDLGDDERHDECQPAGEEVSPLSGVEESSPEDPPEGGGGAQDMSQSYHEIFDTQMLRPAADRASPVSSGSTSTGTRTLPEVYYSEGKLVCEEDNTATQYLTSKLVADSIMWRETFRNDSPSPVDTPPPPACPDTPTVTPAAAAADDVAVSRPADTVDPAVLADMEREARRLAGEVDTIVEGLGAILQSVSALTVDTVETYRDGVCKTCDEVDNNIKAMYQLMAKWEELNKNMAPAQRVSGQIKDVKRLLEMFELAMGP